MNFKTFIENVKEQIVNHLTEDYRDCEINISTITRSDGEQYEGMIIRRSGDKDHGIVPVLNLSDAYEKYQAGCPFEAILQKLADIRMNAPMPGGISREEFLSFDKVKSRIYPMLVNAKNETSLKDKPHRIVSDMALVYGIFANDFRFGLSKIDIDNILLEIWGIRKEKLHEVAIRNLESQTPIFVNLESASDSLEASFDLDSVDDSDFPLYLLTNRQKMFGASMVFTKYMDKIVEKFGPVYVLAPNIHEVLILPKRIAKDVQMGIADIAGMVFQLFVDGVNGHTETRLSENVYEYDYDGLKQVEEQEALEVV